MRPMPTDGAWPNSSSTGTQQGHGHPECGPRVIRRRPNRHQYGYKYVRLVPTKGGIVLFQSRAWHPVVGSVNIGLFRCERDAIAATRRWIQAGCDPCQGLAEGVLPKWVKRANGGQFVGVITQNGLTFRTTTYPTPEAAFQAVVRWKSISNKRR
jgi:hypothetical protein